MVLPLRLTVAWLRQFTYRVVDTSSELVQRFSRELGNNLGPGPYWQAWLPTSRTQMTSLVAVDAIHFAIAPYADFVTALSTSVLPSDRHTSRKWCKSHLPPKSILSVSDMPAGAGAPLQTADQAEKITDCRAVRRTNFLGGARPGARIALCRRASGSAIEAPFGFDRYQTLSIPMATLRRPLYKMMPPSPEDHCEPTRVYSGIGRYRRACPLRCAARLG